MSDTHSTPSRVQAGLSRWGLPQVGGGNRALLAAAAIDSTGSGLFFAFHVIYFVETTSLSLTQVGAALSLAQLLALPAPAAIGPLVDRFGPRIVAVVGNLLSAVGFLGFLGAQDFWQVAVAGLVVQVGVNFYWTSSGALVALAAREAERTRWFGLIQALRNAGVAVGGALAALAVGGGGVGWLRWLVLANVVSYIAAACLTGTWRPPRGRRADDSSSGGRQGVAGDGPGDAGPATEKASYLSVVRDGAYLRVVVVNLVAVLAALVLNVLLAVYIIEGLHGAAWWAGVLLTVNTLLIAVFQAPTTRSTERRRATVVIAVGALLNVVAFAAFAGLSLAPAWTVVPGLVAAIVVYSLAEMLQSPTISMLSTSMAPDAMRGRYLAVYQSSWNIGGALAPVLFMSLLARGPAWPWVLLVALNFGSVVVLTDLQRRHAGRLPDHRMFGLHRRTARSSGRHRRTARPPARHGKTAGPAPIDLRPTSEVLTT